MQRATILLPVIQTAKTGPARTAQSIEAPDMCNCARPRTWKTRAGHLGLLPAIALAVLPKCPLCLAAWFGLLGVAGVNSWLSAAWSFPVWVTLLSFTVGVLAWRARSGGDGRPLAAGVLGAAALLAGKYLTGTLLTGIGLVLLAAAYLWSSRAGLSVSRRCSVSALLGPHGKKNERGARHKSGDGIGMPWRDYSA